MAALTRFRCRARIFRVVALMLAVWSAMLTAVRFSGAQESVPASSSTVRDRGSLRVADLRFDNFLGVVSSNLEVRAGDEAGLKFFVEGFSREELKDEAGRPEYRVHLRYTIDVFDPDGKPLQPAADGEIQTILSMQDDGWRPSIEWSTRIPATAPTGRYPVRIRVQDELGGHSVEHTANLRVSGIALKTSGQFEILGVEFAPSDRGPWRPIWYFERRSPVYVRYKISGFGVGADKQIRVEQGWTVVNSNGEEVISEPVAVVEESKGFYPPRYMQSYFSLSLRDPEPGEYRIRIAAEDTVGSQSAEVEARFVLRP